MKVSAYGGKQEGEEEKEKKETTGTSLLRAVCTGRFICCSGWYGAVYEEGGGFGELRRDSQHLNTS